MVGCVIQTKSNNIRLFWPDNGPQFLSKDFKEFIRQSGMTHVKTSPYYSQSNGKVETANKTMKKTMRPAAVRTLEEAKIRLEEWVTHCNDVRLHSAIGYVAPRAVLDGTREKSQVKRDERLAFARSARREPDQEAFPERMEAVM